MLRLSLVLAVLVSVTSNAEPFPSAGSLMSRTGDVAEPSYDYLMGKYGAKGVSNTQVEDAEVERLLAKYSDFLSKQNSTGDMPDSDVSKYWAEHAEYALKTFGLTQDVKTDNSSAMSLLQVGTGKAQSACEVCVYVIENKEQHQPFLCRGLKAPSQQQTCVSCLVSLFWWLENEVYWVNYGCQRQGSGANWEWVKPCPAHAVCSFIQSLYDRSAFCPADPNYKKPSA